MPMNKEPVKGTSPCAGQERPENAGGRWTEQCQLCGAPLSYLLHGDEVTCSSCGRKETGHVVCPNGHYICDHCHNREALRLIEIVVYSSFSTDPLEIAELAMEDAGLPMLGCQHAYIAGGALMAALRNEGSLDISNADIEEVFTRTAEQARGGYCGLTGVCGIVPAMGACLAVVSGSRCGTDKEQRTTMELVTRVSGRVAELTGPSCCKAYVRAALQEAADFFRTSRSIEFDTHASIECRFSARHPHGCRKERCPYYRPC